MPGYIMHMAEANLILNKIGHNKSEEWRRIFIAGSLLPDTKKKTEKITSHFWNPDTLEDMAIAPDLSRFLMKYRQDLNLPLVLGYYAHLHLDQRFVRDYWPDMAAFYDDEGRVQVKKKCITRTEIKKTGEVVSRDMFFSGEYYYGDYSKLNGYFVDRYHVDLEQNYAAVDTCPIQEVDVKDLQQVLRELRMIMHNYDRNKEEEIRVFSKKRLCKFLENTAEEFVKEIEENGKIRNS